MGVTGLWRLIEPSGKPVPLETLENKVLAIDISIWLHQAIKGFQDSQGGPLPNAHLLGIYHRVCKLLYFRIKPIFVFDGGVPNLKRETISKRQQLKSRKLSEAERLQKHLITSLLKHSAVNQVLSETARASLASKANLPKANLLKSDEKEDIYKLPPTDFDSTLSSDEETTDTSDFSPTKAWDLHTIDEKSPHFKALPADVRHEILTELKETRKQNSWGRIHELPKQSGDFSSFQMKRLLKRYSVQASLEEAEKEMGGRSLSLAELETLLKEQGVEIQSNVGSRIASDENTRYLLIKDVKKAMDEAKREKEVKEGEENTKSSENSKASNENSQGSSESSNLSEFQQDLKKTIELSSEEFDSSKNPDAEFQEDLQTAIELSLRDMPSTSEESGKKRKLNFSFLSGFTDADFMSSGESDEEIYSPRNLKKLESAKSYMMEYSGLTLNEITKIIDTNAGSKKSKVNLKNIHISKNITEMKKPLVLPTIEEKNDQNKVQGENALEDSKALKGTLLNNIELKDKKGAVERYNNKEKDVNEPVEIMSNDSDDSNDLILVEEKTSNGDVEGNKEIESKNRKETLEEKSRSKEKEVSDPVESMSDDSDDTNDFLEVSSEDSNKNYNQRNKKNNKPVIEVIIDPSHTLENDIFSDIFVDTPENNAENVDLKDSEDKNDKSVKNDIIKNKQENSKISCLPESKIESKEMLEEDKNEKTENREEKRTEKKEVEKLTEKQLKMLESNLREETTALAAEKQSKERMAANLTDQIHQEAQELLQLFGVPYVVAPMEAEAQCAFLELINLTHGTITDDSDIWLFGGKTVYKNFFNMNKRVMEYQADDIQRHFKLTREQMILLALLVGSDYTVGLQGIGPVTALEVLAAFPPSKPAINVTLSHDQLISGLGEFRKWLMGGKTVGPGRTALRNKLRNVTANESFPSLQVVKAYLDPTVDSSNEPFSWGAPDVPGLIAFARQKFGWTQSKSEEILKPVLKRLKECRTQKSIKDYFQTKHKMESGDVENKMSKRVKQAVRKIGNEPGEADEEEQPKKKRTTNRNAQTKSKSKRATKRSANRKKSEESDTVNIPEFSSDEDLVVLAKVQADSKKKVEEINKEIKNEIEKQLNVKPKPVNLHKKETIPQREKDKIDALRSKLKAIETFRKSKKGPGYVNKRNVASTQPKEDAGLSESESD